MAIFLNNKLNYKRGLSFNNPQSVRSVLATGDPYENNVVLFLKGDGANGSVNIVDSSLTPKSVSVFGNAQISTAQSKYGESSLYFDGSGDYLQTEDSSDYAFGTDDFTIEFWLFKETTGQVNLIDFRPGGTGVYFLLYSVGNNIYYHIAGGNRITGVLPGNSQWVHVALSKESNISRLFIQGIQHGNDFTDNYDFVSTNKPTIGASNNRNEWFLNGYFDSLRITKGIARYTANFNPEADVIM